MQKAEKHLDAYRHPSLHFLHISSPKSLTPQWGTADADTEVPSAEKPDFSQVRFSKPGIASDLEREREKERERETETETETETERDTHTHRDRHRDRETDRQRQRQKDTERQRQTETET